MRNFILGVIAAVLAALLAHVAQSYWDHYEQNGKYSLKEIKYNPELILSKATFDALEKSGAFKNDGYFSGIKISLIEIDNNGNAPITDQDVRIVADAGDFVGGGIVAFQNDSVPGNDEIGTRVSLKQKQLDITYKVLNPGDSHMLWVFYDKLANLKIVARRPDLNVDSWDVGVSSWDRKKSTDWFPYILISFVAIIIVLVIGMVIHERITSSFLLKRGYDLKKMMKEPESEINNG